MVYAQDDTHAIQPVDQEDEYIRTRSNPEWYTKSGLANVVRKTSWFDLLLKSDIDQNENHILGPSTNDVELEYHVDQLKAAVLSEAKWNSDENDVFKPRKFKQHMSKNTKPHPSFYNNDFYYLVSLSTEEKYTTYLTKHYAARYYKQGIKDMIPNRWCKKNHNYIFEALNSIHHWEDSRIDFFKAEMSTRTERNVYSDLMIKLVVHIVVKKKWGYGFLTSIVVRRSDDQEYEFNSTDLPRLSLNDVEDMYLLQVQDKLHHLPLEFVKDFNNALLLFIKRVVIQNRVEDIQLGVESYQQTLNLTKPMMFFEGINQRIPFIMTTTHKGIVYLNQHNIKSLMKLSEVKKFYDGTLVNIQKNPIDMVTKNKMGKDNKRLKGRYWTDIDVMKSNEMVRKIDQTLKRKEQLRRLEEYVRGRTKIINPFQAELLSLAASASFERYSCFSSLAKGVDCDTCCVIFELLSNDVPSSSTAAVVEQPTSDHNEEWVRAMVDTLDTEMIDVVVGEPTKVVMQGIVHWVCDDVTRVESSLTQDLGLITFSPSDVVVALSAQEKECGSPLSQDAHMTALEDAKHAVVDALFEV
ncbi:hypothetical protein Tco_1575279 [Tanacetum coccineum]